MKKTILALLLVLSFAAAYDLRGNNFLSNTSPSQRNFEFVDESCSHAVKSFNRGIRQLVWDVRAQSNKWVVYADLDALDEMSYYLTNSCSDDDFQLTSKLGLSLTRPEQKACTDLMEIVDSLLERKRTEEFRGGYQAGIALSQQALELGQNIADGCKIRLLAKEQEAQSSKEESQAEEQDESSDDDDDSDENQDSDQDSDDDTNEESDENDDGVQGIHIGVVRERNGRKEKYTINVKPRDHGEPEVSVRHTVAGEEEEEAVSDWDLSDWNNEEWNNAEWANEELAPGRWNNEEWNNAEWANEEWAIGEWSDSEWSDSDNEWSTEEWNDEENEEWGNEEWNNEEGSDESSDSSDELPFFYTVNPKAKTDSGNYWRDGGYKRYYGGNDGGKGPNFGDFYWAI